MKVTVSPSGIVPAFDVTLAVNFTVRPTRDGLPELVTFVIVANGLFTTWLNACEVLDRFML